MTTGRNLIINYLPPSFRDLELMQLFQPFGRILQVKVVRNKANNESLTYGFVLFANSEDAIKALEALNGYSIYGKHIKVSLARRRESLDKRSKLYVTRIPANFTWDMTHELFSQFGNIIEFRLLVDEEGKSRQIAFVEYSNRKESDKALIALSGYIPPGEKQSILIKYAIHPNSFPSPTCSEEYDSSPTYSFPEENYDPKVDFQLPQSQQNINGNTNYTTPYYPPAISHLPPQSQVPPVVSYTYPTHISYQPLTTLPTFPLIPSNPTALPHSYNLAYNQQQQQLQQLQQQSYSNKSQPFISTNSDYERYQESYYSPNQNPNRKQYGIEIANTASTPVQTETKYLVVLSGLLPHHDIFTCQFLSSLGKIVESTIKQTSIPKSNSTTAVTSPTTISSAASSLTENIISGHYYIVPKTNLQIVEILKLHNTQLIIDGTTLYAQVTTI